MTSGKRWPEQEEERLIRLYKENPDLGALAAEFGKTPGAIRKKLKRLGVKVVVRTPSVGTTTSLKLPKELPSVEEALKILAAALKMASEAGLDKVEVQRLQVVATLARTYKDLVADYIGYRRIEAEVAELKRGFEKLLEEKTEGS